MAAAAAVGGIAAALVSVTQSSAQLPYGGYPTTTYSQPTTMTSTQPSPAPAPTSTNQGASQAPPARAAANTVTVNDDFFRPSKLTVKRGSVVTWKWAGMNVHNVTFTQLHKHSRDQTSGTFRLRFSKKGTYHYLCTIHRFKGTIVVR